MRVLLFNKNGFSYRSPSKDYMPLEETFSNVFRNTPVHLKSSIMFLAVFPGEYVILVVELSTTREACFIKENVYK